MAAKITPRLIELTYEATLKSHWRKKALAKFLRGSHVSESFLATWAETESKREFLDRMFSTLQKTDRGKALIYQMARHLSEKRTFPDLRDWEDSDQKIQEAHRAVQELKHYLREQDEEIRSERDKAEAQQRAREEREKIQRSLTDKTKLQQELESLHSKIGTQEGGYEFEDWFYRMLDYCEITNRKPYKSGGRQIDGSLTLDGTTYLVELKFQRDQASATDVDSLKAKVNKMADNTMGIMVSMSGYSSVAISDASGSKTTTLLLDAGHVYLFLMGSMGFDEILARVRRHASQTGEAYLPANKFSG